MQGVEWSKVGCEADAGPSPPGRVTEVRGRA